MKKKKYLFIKLNSKNNIMSINFIDKRKIEGKAMTRVYNEMNKIHIDNILYRKESKKVKTTIFKFDNSYWWCTSGGDKKNCTHLFYEITEDSVPKHIKSHSIPTIPLSSWGI